MSLIAVDIGNTNITVGLFDKARKLVHHWSLLSDARRTPDEYRLLLRQLAQEEPSLTEAKGLIVASVVPSLTGPIERVFKQLAPGAESMRLLPTTPLPVRNAYRVPEEVGADRLADAVGGWKRYGTPLIVVDFGTATTFDVVDAEPCYLGGIIMPGPRLAAEALNLRTARLPLVTPEPTPKLIAGDTVGSIQAGLFWSMVGAIDYLIEQVAQEASFGTDYKAVATGGLAREYVQRCKNLSEYAEDLTLEGLAAVFDFQSDS